MSDNGLCLSEPAVHEVEGKGDPERCQEDVTEDVAEVCGGKESCTLPSDFSAGCTGIFHTLEISWDCVSAVAAKDDTEDAKPQTPEQEAKVMEQAIDTVKKIKNDKALTAGFNPCYRTPRISMLRQLDIKSLFGRLTNCPSGEGCFRLNWEDKREFTDPDRPPTPNNIFEATLSHGNDMQVTWRGIGLERNPYSTWGICLPLEDGRDYAMAVFEDMKLKR